MKAVAIHDTSPAGALSFDLADLLLVAGPRARESTWQCQLVECVGALADVLHSMSDRGIAISGDALVHIASGVTQVIDGEFIAQRPDETAPWLIIRAIDSTCYVVISDDHALIDRIRARFQDVRDSLDDVAER